MAQQKWLITCFLLFVVLYSPVNPANSQSNNDLLNRISRLESEMSDLNRHLFSEKRAVEAPSGQKATETTYRPLSEKAGRAVGVPAHQSAAAQNIVKLQRLEALVRSLQGVSEELNNRIDKLVGDLDRRLAVLETDAPFKDKVIARQQAEILGVGLAKPEPEIVEVPVVEEVVEVEQVPIAVEDAFVSEIMDEVVEDSPSPPMEQAPPAVEEESIPLPTGVVEVDNTPAIEREFRNLIQELLDAGVDPSDMMTDPRLEEITERALAQNFETWPVFMQMVS